MTQELKKPTRLFLFLCSLLLFAGIWNQNGHAFSASTTDATPTHIEAYTHTRPDIFTVTPIRHSDLGDFWERLKRGHLESVALFIELYAGFERYYIARDAELLYDLERLLTKNNKEILGKSHLVNISRLNLKDENIWNYLADNGLSEIHFQNGKKALFIDTGYRGTIPKALKQHFQDSFHPQMLTHLLVSRSEDYPSTRVFLTGIDPHTPRLNPSLLHILILPYEHMARYTQRSTAFLKIDDQWEAVSFTDNLPKNQSGKVDPIEALKYMEDLSYYAQRPQTQELFHQKRALWKKARDLFTGGKKESLVKFFKQILKENPYDPFTESLVRDFIEVVERNGSQFGTSHPLSIKAAELGLPEIPSTHQRAGMALSSWPEEALHAWAIDQDFSALADLLSNPQSVDLLEKEFLMLEEDFDHGKHGIVSKVKRLSDGQIFALKRPRDDSPEHHISFSKEIERAKIWKELGLSDIEVFWHPDGKSLLKSFVDGHTIEQVLLDPSFWTEESVPKKTLKEWILRAASSGFYVGDLNRKNVKLTSNGIWKILDSGSIKNMQNREDALKEYRQKLFEKWSKKANKALQERLKEFLDDLSFS